LIVATITVNKRFSLKLIDFWHPRSWDRIPQTGKIFDRKFDQADVTAQLPDLTHGIVREGFFLGGGGKTKRRAPVYSRPHAQSVSLTAANNGTCTKDQSGPDRGQVMSFRF